MQLGRETALGLAHHALEVGHHRVREGQCLALFEDVFRRELVLHHKNRKVSHHLGGRRHLDDIAQHEVDLPVHLAHVLELAAEAECLDLRLQVRVLPARHFVAVDIGRGRLKAAVKRRISQAHVRPVVAELLQLIRVEAGVAVLSVQRGDDRVHGRLAGHGRQRVDRRVYDIHARLGCEQQRRHLVARGVVRVQVDGQADLALERGDQLLGCIGLE